MANTFASAGLEQLASAMVAGLYDGGVLIQTVYRDAETDLVVGKGDTVTIREPQAVAAANFTGSASATNLVEAKIAVAVDHQPYNQVKITAKDATLHVEDAAQQLVMPQVAGIAEYIDSEISDLLATTTNTLTGVTDWSASIAEARGSLSSAKVPLMGRYLAVAPDVASDLLQSTVFQTGNIEGAPAALADGILGRLYGFTVVESAHVAPATAVAYHQTAVAGVFRTPVTPQGAASGSASLDGVTAQLVYSYDNGALSDVLTAQTLFGLGTSDTSFNSRAVLLSVA